MDEGTSGVTPVDGGFVGTSGVAGFGVCFKISFLSNSEMYQNHEIKVP